ncbi:MAG TPA: DUF2608 domain-containing protein [Rhabdochlamydiaceae bacterium]|jgi:hypothetical protein
MKIRILFLVFVTCISSYLRSEVLELQHFREIDAHITPETLIVLDIDDTLLIPSQMLGCDEWFRYRIEKYSKAGMNASSALEKSLAEWESVRHITRMEIVEPQTDAIVRALQEQGYSIMGLTTQGLALATLTVQQLRANNIDLLHTAPCKDDHYFMLSGHGVLLRQGILFASGKHKGEVLFTMLDKIGLSPKRIAFINDKAAHLYEMEKTALERNVSFVGLRYAYSDARKAAFRPEIAELQFSQSTFTHLLSDEEALSLMEEDQSS